jgi:hypothetical protein
MKAWGDVVRRGAAILGIAALGLALLGAMPAAAQSIEDAQPAEAEPLVTAPDSAVDPAVPLADQQPRTCPVPPQPYWTASEAYTWRQICLGQWADLAAAFADPETATGDLDKWKPERNLGAAFLLRIMTDPAYVAATPFTGIRIDGAHFPEALVLSDLEYNLPLIIADSVFSDQVAMERYRSKSRVRFSGSWFRLAPRADAGADAPVTISLDISGAEIAKGLNLNLAFANGAVDLSDTLIAGHVELDDVTFLDKLWLNRARIGGVLFMQRSRVGSDLVLDGADVAQNIELLELSLSRALDNGDTEYGLLSGRQLHVSGHLIIGSSEAPVRMPARLTGQAVEAAAGAADAAQEPQVEPQVEPGPALDSAASLPDASETAPLSATDLTGTESSGGIAADAAAAPAAAERSYSVRAWQLNLTGARIDGELRMRGLWLLQQVTLEDAVIGDDLWLSESEVGRAAFSATSVKGFVLLQGLRVKEQAQLDSASIGRSLVMDDQTELTGWRMPGASVKGGIYLAGAKVSGPADLNSISVDRDLALGDGAVFSGPVDASFARIGGSLDLTNGAFASVNLTGAEIAAELRLAAAGAVPQFAREAELNLRNTTVNTLQDVAESWPCVLHLEGFTYQRQIRSERPRRAVAAPDPCGADSVAATSEDRRAAELISWLSRQQPFSPQPYVQLAAVLRQSGDNETAKAVLFAGKAREWQAAGPWSKFLLSLQFAFTGFGLYPYVAGYWVLALIGIGTAVFSLDPSPELRRLTWPQRFIYSCDMLIPAVHLRHHHGEIELQSWPRYYLYGHKLMGYVLLSFLAAALLGLGGLE